jgi:CRP-like cAMP-binding protein
MSVAGGGFAPAFPETPRLPKDLFPIRAELLEAIPLFATLTAEERRGLLESMSRQTHQAGAVVGQRGTVMQSLYIVGRGVLVAWEEAGGEPVESARLTPGLYFGEMGLLTGAPLSGAVTALKQTVLYEISKDALAPILKARPAVADDLGETLELRLHARQNALDRNHHVETSRATFAGRLADTIRHLFSLH